MDKIMIDILDLTDKQIDVLNRAKKKGIPEGYSGLYQLAEGAQLIATVGRDTVKQTGLSLQYELETLEQEKLNNLLKAETKSSDKER